MMAKAHETTGKKRASHEDTGDEAAPPKGTVESYEDRLMRGAQLAPPTAVDYDRDGYPDAVVGRSGRNFARFNLNPNTSPGGKPGSTGALSLGVDSFRQDQIGYRDRLRSRIAVIQALRESGEPVSPQMQAAAMAGVPSHGSTGVPGTTPATTVAPAAVASKSPVHKVTPTPLEQAQTAPRTPLRRPVQVAQTGIGSDPVVTAARQGSFGNVPAQGTIQPDGSFVQGAKPGEAKPGEAKEADEDEGHAKPEHHKAAEHHKAEPHKAEPHKAPEHHRPEPHRAPEHHKPAEHKPHEKK